VAEINNLKADDEVTPDILADIGVAALALPIGIAANIVISVVFKKPLRLTKLNGLLIFAGIPRFELLRLRQ
jgi:hypothetical protein